MQAAFRESTLKYRDTIARVLILRVQNTGVVMTESTQRILKEALGLSPAERAALIDELTSSLDRPDPGIEERWAKEAEDRLRAYRAGELEAIAEEEIVEEFKAV
jgi:putative addiction module component (TIGR02574 family)